MPPGSHSFSTRAAILTPSPKMSSPSMMMSPMFIPMRNWIRGPPAVARHFLLNRDRASHGINRACELDQHTVAGGFNDTALMSRDCGINDLAPMRPQSCECADFISTHQA